MQHPQHVYSKGWLLGGVIQDRIIKPIDKRLQWIDIHINDYDESVMSSK